jgi:hypothetical protein
VLDITVVRGRRFTPTERTADAGVAIVTDAVARRLWPTRDAVVQVVRLQPPHSDSPAAPSLSSNDARNEEVQPARALIVIGVVRDVNGPLASDFFPSHAVYLPTDSASPGTSLTLRLRGDLEQTRQALLERLTRVDPGLGQINSMRTLAGMQAYILRIAFWVAVVLGGLALVLTASGLFGVLSFIVEQRAKDIGVRMALGATTGDVAGLVLSQSIRPVGIGLLAGGGLAAALAIVLMATPMASAIGSLVRVFDPVAYVSSLVVIVTSCLLAVSVPALRAARIDPIAMLREE